MSDPIAESRQSVNQPAIRNPQSAMLVSVAVPVPFLDALTYAVPDGVPAPPIGARVLVPVGARTLTGCVVEADPARPAPGDVKSLVEVIDREAFVPPGVVALAQWTAEYYACGPGEALAAAMPPGAWIESERRLRLTDAGRAALDTGRPGDALDDEAAAALAAVGRRKPLTGAEVQALGAVLRRLERQGLIERVQELRGRASAFRTIRVAAVTAAGLEAVSGEATPGARQRELLSVLGGSPAGIPVPDLVARGFSRDTIARAARRGAVTICRVREERDPFHPDGSVTDRSVAVEPQRRLTGEQAAALSRLSALAAERAFRVTLLHGVTGSGKTEVYVRLAAEVRRAGRCVLVLVPEIALTPAVAAIFRGAFGDQVAIQHSGLSDGERHDQWHRVRRGEVGIVVGTRSAVFAPLADVGLIIVDEEHDASYKQEDAPRYHGRDVAVMRAKREGALVVLGSATPSLETWQNAVAGKYERIALTRRVLDRPLADVRIVNMRDEYAEVGPDVVVSRPLQEAIGRRLAAGEQVLVLLNRRGYATAVFCRQCGDSLDCPNCSVSLTVHRAGAGWRARCHYCNGSVTVPKACPRCAAPYLEQIGFGTQRVEAELRALFPGARLSRVDRDTIRRRGAIGTLLARFSRGEIDVLVGTQMIAKGHDFPEVTLVGVISADVGLGIADFRASERTFQLLTQVAGRAGRGEKRGEAIIQTIHPEHYSIQLAGPQDYGAFVQRELRFRHAMRYPPFVAMINVIVRGRTFSDTMDAAADLVRALTPTAPAAGFSVLGPAPAPLNRLRGEHRAQFFVKGSHRPEMRAAVQAVVAARPDLTRRVTIDVDPLSVL